MLSSEETIDVIAEALTSHQIPSVVLDPVILSCRSVRSKGI
jgi:hydroxymethylpyrimidine/phosphomethylpyrimidine kinase